MLSQLSTVAVKENVPSELLNDLGRQGTGGGIASNLQVSAVVALIFKVMMAVGAVGFMLVILFAGFRYLIAGGNDESAGKAKKMMLAGVIGLLIIFAAFGLGSAFLNIIGVL